MRRVGRIAVAFFMSAYVAPSIALAQRFDFERTIDVSGPIRLDVSTSRGKIEVLAGAPGRIVVEGTATVRVGFNVPANAVDLARQVAASPPIEQDSDVVRLHDPVEREAQRAVTVAYRVHVPRNTAVNTVSESGETSIRGVAATVDARTQSAALDLADLDGSVQISTGSGAVQASAIFGALSVTTASSGFSGSRLKSSLRVRTQSGDVDADLEGSGDVDVETGSSGINLRGVRGGLIVKTQSGRVAVLGTPLKDWTVTTSSSSIGIDLVRMPGFGLDASSRSGSVALGGASLPVATTKHSAKGTVGEGGPTVRLRTGSGAIRVHVIEIQ